MSEYHKIETIYKREPDGKRLIIEGEYSNEYFKFLANTQWEWTEKVDGTNIRVIIDPAGSVTFGGRTADAQIPAFLVKRLQELFLPQIGTLHQEFPNGATLYGEGYGAKIQKVGSSYRPDQDFVLFDVKVGEWWLKRDAVEAVGRNLGLMVVPIVGTGTLTELTEFVRQGFNSRWTHGGAFLAEGVVARPVVELRTRANQRIITKLKYRDFVKEEKKERRNGNIRKTDQEMENHLAIVDPCAGLGCLRGN